LGADRPKDGIGGGHQKRAWESNEKDIYDLQFLIPVALGWLARLAGKILSKLAVPAKLKLASAC